MSKIIKLTDENLDEIRRDFETALHGLKLSDGKINFTKSFGNIDRKAKLYFTEVAYLKMLTLVREFDKEVAWHGIAHRKDDEADAYVISDILVYPQEVTGSTVNTDQEEYQMWLMNQEDDVFNNIRMQGHSHVNMGTSPSTVDTSLYERILEQLDDDMFYIFLIWNKRNEKTIKIYDLAENVLFETADVTVSVLDGDIRLEAFVGDAKEMVKEKKYTYPTYGGNKPYGYNGNYSVYGGTQGKGTEDKKVETSKTGSGGGVDTGIGGKKKKKKKRSDESDKRSGAGSSYWSRYGYDDYDDDFDGYRYGGYR